MRACVSWFSNDLSVAGPAFHVSTDFTHTLIDSSCRNPCNEAGDGVKCSPAAKSRNSESADCGDKGGNVGVGKSRPLLGQFANCNAHAADDGESLFEVYGFP